MLTGAMYDPQLHEAYRLLIIKVYDGMSSTFVLMDNSYHSNHSNFGSGCYRNDIIHNIAHLYSIQYWWQ